MDIQKMLFKKIHIIGAIGSGKTTLAKKISKQLTIPHFELDNVVWERFDTGDLKRTIQQRDEHLRYITASEKWITEGVHYEWIDTCFQNADLILLLDIKLPIRRFRIVKRYFLQKVGVEKANYKPSFKVLMDLYNYNRFFEYVHKQEIIDALDPYKNKVIVLKNNAEITHLFNDWFN